RAARAPEASTQEPGEHRAYGHTSSEACEIGGRDGSTNGGPRRAAGPARDEAAAAAACAHAPGAGRRGGDRRRRGRARTHLARGGACPARGADGNGARRGGLRSFIPAAAPDDGGGPGASSADLTRADGHGLSRVVGVAEQVP